MVNPKNNTTKIPKNFRQVMTPEGVLLNVELAGAGERLGAVLLDLLFLGLAFLAVVLGVVFSGLMEYGTGLWIAFFWLSFFLLRNFYFTFFELRWRGTTPGKRLIGLRVMNRNGGPLLAEAVFARNLLRELELYLPLSAIFSIPDVPGWVDLLGWVWIGIFVLIPFINKDRMRAGDMVGGTWVVAAPKGKLLPDLADGDQRAKIKNAGSVPNRTIDPKPAFTFTDAQLDIYGIYELQTLENVLRLTGPQSEETLKEVTNRIQKKIGWVNTKEFANPKPFLEAFYGALRARLEARMLLGERRENKFDIAQRSGSDDSHP